MNLSELLAIDTNGMNTNQLKAHNKKIASAQLAEQTVNTVLTTFSCKVPANKPNAISFAPAIPDGIDIGATIDAVCIATESDYNAILNPATPIKVKKAGQYFGKEILNFNLPFSFTNDKGQKFTKNVNCNGSTVESGITYSILKIEEIGVKDGLPKTYEKYVLQG